MANKKGKATGIIATLLIAGSVLAFNQSDDFKELISDHLSNESHEDAKALKDCQYSDSQKDYYAKKGKSNIQFSQFPKAGKYDYSNTDKLGRTQEAKATINYKSFAKSKGVRQSFKAGSEPSGWGKNGKVKLKSADGTKTYNGYMYNRSHLIGDALGGDAIKENAITGTRTQNVGQPGTSTGGMRYSESKVEKYMNTHKKGIVYYKAKPNYHDNEQLPRTVDISMQSKDGQIDEKVRVFNNAKDYYIDFKDGSYKKVK